MLYDYTLDEIRSNTNPGVEYEIALFYALLSVKPEEQREVMTAYKSRDDSAKIDDIIGYTSIQPITSVLRERGLNLIDVTFETQNDDVGPADVILVVCDKKGVRDKIGLSIKFSNTCTLNVTGKKFITEVQIDRLCKEYTDNLFTEYIEYMTKKFGNAANWRRKRSPVTDKMIDLIRDEVIFNWPNVKNKTELLKNLFHSESPIDFWVVNYNKEGYTLQTKPSTIDVSKANDIVVKKYQTSYITFHLGSERVGHMQVKFNNGFLEHNTRHDGTRKKQKPDYTQDGIEFIYGNFIGSWNFSVEE